MGLLPSSMRCWRSRWRAACASVGKLSAILYISRMLVHSRVHTICASVLLTVALLLPAGAVAQLPRVLVITTGGTIGLSGMELVEGVPQLAKIADVTVEEFVRFGSSSMTPKHWVGLSRRINQAFANDPGVAAVIVTHGTDTMEETAYFLHLTVKDRRPVVITGAMR